MTAKLFIYGLGNDVLVVAGPPPEGVQLRMESRDEVFRRVKRRREEEEEWGQRDLLTVNVGCYEDLYEDTLRAYPDRYWCAHLLATSVAVLAVVNSATIQVDLDDEDGHAGALIFLDALSSCLGAAEKLTLHLPADGAVADLPPLRAKALVIAGMDPLKVPATLITEALELAPEADALTTVDVASVPWYYRNSGVCEKPTNIARIQRRPDGMCEAMFCGDYTRLEVRERFDGLVTFVGGQQE